MSRNWMLLTALTTMTACRAGKVIEDTGDEVVPVDADADGYTADEDCDDADPGTNPGATEVCDGVDNDCDAEIDEDVLDTFFADADEEGTAIRIPPSRPAILHLGMR